MRPTSVVRATSTRTAATATAGAVPRGRSVFTAARSRSIVHGAGARRSGDGAAKLGDGKAEDWLGRWALNLMLINVSTRRFGRAVRLPEGDIPASDGAGMSKSAVSRRFVALSAVRMSEWMAADLSKLDLIVIQIDGIQIETDLVLLAAVGIDGDGVKHPLGVLEGASENAAVAQALLDNLIERGLDPKICRLFIIDGAKALRKAIRKTFGKHTPVQRCHIDKGRNIGASSQAPACLGAPDTASSMGAGRRGEGGKVDPQSRAPAGANGTRCLGQHPRGH